MRSYFSIIRLLRQDGRCLTSVKISPAAIKRAPIVNRGVIFSPRRGIESKMAITGFKYEVRPAVVAEVFDIPQVNAM